MEIRYKRSKVGTIVGGIASVILGILAFVYPDTTAMTFTVAAGWVLTIFGIASLISAITSWSVILSSVDLYTGIISLLFGLLILYMPAFFVAWIFILLGIYIMWAGFSTLMGSNALRVVGVRGSGWGIVLAILAIVLGIMVVVSPLASASAAVMICGVALVYTGVVRIIEGVRMPKEGQD